MVAGTCPTPLIDHCQDGVCYVTQSLPSQSHKGRGDTPMSVLLPVSFFTAEAAQLAQLSQFGIWRSVGTAGGRPAPQTTAVGGSPPCPSSEVAGVWEGGWRSSTYRNRDKEGTSCPIGYGMPILQHSAVGEVLRDRPWLPSRVVPKIHWMPFRWYHWVCPIVSESYIPMGSLSMLEFAML